jgi:hypothetical protein
MPVNRRQFVRIVPALGAFAVSHRSFAAQPEPVWPILPRPGEPVDDPFPSHHPALVKNIVGVSHTDLARVRELVDKYPALAKASWDWGFGDWETALGAASHTGQRAIAELLLDRGAPPTVFSAAMLGQLDVVTSFAATIPKLIELRGPHGIPLMTHAKLGGPQAAQVVQFLESLGPDKPPAYEPLSADDRAAIEGQYVFGTRPRDRFIVDTRQNQLGIVRVGATRRGLGHLGRLEFHPVGAPAVRIKFERAAGKVVALGVYDPDLVVRAAREAGTA